MPTAIFAGSDAIALGVMMQARRRGIAIPDALSLVGFDGLPIVDLLGPPLSSVAQPIDELGRLAAARLLSMIDGAADDPDVSRLPVRLVERGSVAAPVRGSGPASAVRTPSEGGKPPASDQEGRMIDAVPEP
jgi:LacI family transcriptional regulator